MADEIEVRGQTLDEALPKVEEFLDHAARNGRARVLLIHGKGTGAMRRAVRELLDRHPLVTSYETAERAEGACVLRIAEILLLAQVAAGAEGLFALAAEDDHPRVFLLLGAGTTMYLARRIAKAVDLMAGNAPRLLRGQHPPYRPSRIRQLDALAHHGVGNVDGVGASHDDRAEFRVLAAVPRRHAFRHRRTGRIGIHAS